MPARVSLTVPKAPVGTAHIDLVREEMASSIKCSRLDPAVSSGCPPKPSFSISGPEEPKSCLLLPSARNKGISGKAGAAIVSENIANSPKHAMPATWLHDHVVSFQTLVKERGTTSTNSSGISSKPRCDTISETEIVELKHQTLSIAAIPIAV